MHHYESWICWRPHLLVLHVEHGVSSCSLMPGLARCTGLAADHSDLAADLEIFVCIMSLVMLHCWSLEQKFCILNGSMFSSHLISYLSLKLLTFCRLQIAAHKQHAQRAQLIFHASKLSSMFVCQSNFLLVGSLGNGMDQAKDVIIEASKQNCILGCRCCLLA